MRQKYVACTANGARIISVYAQDAEEARRLVREQLDRPGRRGYLKAWQDGGEIVEVSK